MSDELGDFNFPMSGSSVDDPRSQTPVESSGVSCQSSPAAPTIRRQPVKSQAKSSKKAPKPTFYCTYQGCKKSYKMKGRFDNHLIAHKISDANARMPSVDDFLVVIESMVKVVMEKILVEPIIGSDSTVQEKFIETIILFKMEDMQWLSFVSSVASPLFMSLEEPSKMFPLNRYEEALTKLNAYLNVKDNIRSLADELSAVTAGDVELPYHVASRLVFRVSHLLLEEVHTYVAKEMRSTRDGEENVECDESQQMSENERVQFIGGLGGLLRAFFLKGLKEESTSKMWRSLCKSLKDKFVSFPSTSVVSSTDFLHKPLWYAKDGLSITISDTVVNFFLFVEGLVKKKSDSSSFPSLEDVMSGIYSNVTVMGYWYSVTNGYFSDENGIYVMKLMVRAFRDKSIQLEQELILRAHSISKVALRTGLKRN